MTTSALFNGRMIQHLLATESSYGVAPGGDWQSTYIYADEVVPSKPMEADPLLGVAGATARDPLDPAPGLYSLGGNLRVPLCLNNIGLWLRLAFGAPVTTGDEGDYSHVFTSGAATLPTYAREVLKATGVYDVNTGEACRSIQFAMAKEAGFRGVTLDILGRKQAVNASSGGGTPVAAPALLPMPAVVGSVLWNAVNAGQALAADLTYATGMAEARYLDGAADADMISAVTPDEETSVVGTIRVRGRNATLDADARSRTPRELQLEYRLSATRLLRLKLARVFLELSGQPITGPGGTEQSFGLRAAQTADAPMIEVTLLNAVASY